MAKNRNRIWILLFIIILIIFYRNRNKSEKTLFIYDKLYINQKAIEYINGMENVESFEYTNKDSLIDKVSNSRIKKIVLLISSTDMFNAGIPNNFADKIFSAPYSTLDTLRENPDNKNNNMYFVQGSDGYLVDFLTGGSFSTVTIILENPSENNNPKIREEINKRVIKNNNEPFRQFQPAPGVFPLKYVIKYWDDLKKLTPGDFKTEIGTTVRRIMFFGSYREENGLLEKIKNTWSGVGGDDPPFVIIYFINYGGLNIELFKEVKEKFPGIIQVIAYVGASHFGNKFLLKNNTDYSELAKLLYESNVGAMTPSLSSLPMLLESSCPWTELEKYGFFYKRKDTDFLAATSTLTLDENKKSLNYNFSKDILIGSEEEQLREIINKNKGDN